MLPVTKTYTTTGAKDPIPLEFQPLSKITAALSEAVTATFAVTVQVTLDQVFEPTQEGYVAPASARWFTVTSAPTTAAGYVTFDGPWRAIRLNIATIDDGSLVFQVAQGSTPRHY